MHLQYTRTAQWPTITYDVIPVRRTLRTFDLLLLNHRMLFLKNYLIKIYDILFNYII